MNKDNIIDTSSINKLVRIMIVILTAILILSCLIYRYNKQTSLPKSHIYVCDDKDNESSFDRWLKADIDWVPSFLIIKDKQEIGIIKGIINVVDFDNELATLLIQHNTTRSMPSYNITNLDNKSSSLENIVTTDDLYIIEVHWIDCEDCKEQDDKYTKSIYAKYSTKNIYRYYLKSDKQKVLAKYN